MRRMDFACLLVGIALTGCAGTQELKVETAPVVSPKATAPPAAAPRDLTFIHMSDSHIGPYLEKRTSFTGERGFETFRFLKDVIAQPQPNAADGSMVPAPRFIMNTGDLVEFSFPGATLDAVDVYEDGIDIPIYWVPGNHDNTWAARPDVFRERFGGMRFHHEAEGIHFIGINSATMQEPVQSIGQEEVEFVRLTANTISDEAPIFLMLHHPPSTGAWSSQYDLGRLLEQLRKKNVVSILVGHHHTARHEDWSGYDVLHGGSTFSKAAAEKPVDGFGIIHLSSETLTATYRYLDDLQPAKLLLQRSITPAKDRAFIDLAGVGVGADTLTVDFTAANLEKVLLTVGDRTGESGTGPATGPIKLSIQDLPNGRHWGKLAGLSGGKLSTERYFEFTLDRQNRPNEGMAQWRLPLLGGVKSTPLLDGNNLIVGVNNETLVAVDSTTGKSLWTTKTEGEVLASPSRIGDFVYAGTMDGKLLVVEPTTGKILKDTTTPGGLPIYSSPTAVGEFVVVGGADGYLAAYKQTTLELAWHSTAAKYAVEAAPVLMGANLLYNGWDGYMHALDPLTGEAQWKVHGPHNRTRVVHYYGGADHIPIPFDERIYTTDRGYHLGVYTKSGAFDRILMEDCTALSSTEDQLGLLVRRLAKPVSRIDMEGNIVWESSIIGGRFPSPPKEIGGRVYFTTDGHLHVIDGTSGESLWSYRITPGLHVFADPIIANGTVFCVGMDGILTAIKAPN